MIRAALAIAFVLLASMVSAQTNPPPFIFEAGDQLTVTVLEDPGLNTTSLVRPDGRISIPIVGEVLVAGRTAAAVQATIQRALAPNFLSPPTVTVALVTLGGGREPSEFFVLGEISRPGRYNFSPPFNLLQALAIAGGPGRFAATRRIQIRRSGDQVVIFNFDILNDGEPPTDLIEMRDGDVIFIPTRGLFE